MTRANTKTADVLKHLQEHGSITSMDAIELYGATRLSSIIFTLKHQGHHIETVMEGGIDRHGHAVNYGRYVYKSNEVSQEAIPFE